MPVIINPNYTILFEILNVLRKREKRKKIRSNESHNTLIRRIYEV